MYGRMLMDFIAVSFDCRLGVTVIQSTMYQHYTIEAIEASFVEHHWTTGSLRVTTTALHQNAVIHVTRGHS